jgi:hypothetical protein
VESGSHDCFSAWTFHLARTQAKRLESMLVGLKFQTVDERLLRIRVLISIAQFALANKRDLARAFGRLFSAIYYVEEVDNTQGYEYFEVTYFLLYPAFRRKGCDQSASNYLQMSSRRRQLKRKRDGHCDFKVG